MKSASLKAIMRRKHIESYDCESTDGSQHIMQYSEPLFECLARGCYFFFISCSFVAKGFQLHSMCNLKMYGKIDIVFKPWFNIFEKNQFSGSVM